MRTVAREYRPNLTGERPLELAAPSARFYPALRNGSKPDGTWAAKTTRWSLRNLPHDVVAWAPAD